MAEFIRKSDALNLDFKISVSMFESRRKTAERAVQAYADAIAALPPEPHVWEVVFCRECKWWTKQEHSIQGRCALGISGGYPSGGWFCGNGRRENG